MQAACIICLFQRSVLYFLTHLEQYEEPPGQSPTYAQLKQQAPQMNIIG